MCEHIESLGVLWSSKPWGNASNISVFCTEGNILVVVWYQYLNAFFINWADINTWLVKLFILKNKQFTTAHCLNNYITTKWTWLSFSSHLVDCSLSENWMLSSEPVTWLHHSLSNWNVKNDTWTVFQYVKYVSEKKCTSWTIVWHLNKIIPHMLLCLECHNKFHVRWIWCSKSTDIRQV